MVPFIDIFQTNCYLQVKKWRKEIIKAYLQFISTSEL